MNLIQQPQNAELTRSAHADSLDIAQDYPQYLQTSQKVSTSQIDLQKNQQD